LTNQKNEFSFKGRQKFVFFQKKFSKKNKGKSQSSKKFSDGFGLLILGGAGAVFLSAPSAKRLRKHLALLGAPRQGERGANFQTRHKENNRFGLFGGK
jgi:hypothetical protein